jgi:hypothetical protein
MGLKKERDFKEKNSKKFVVPKFCTKKELEELNKIEGVEVQQIEGMTYMQLDYLGSRYIYEPNIEYRKENEKCEFYTLRRVIDPLKEVAV